MKSFVSRLKRRVQKKVRLLQQSGRPLVHNLIHLPKTVLKGNRLDTYWSTIDINFGDAITPHLLLHFGLTPIHAAPDTARLASTGSILHHLPDDYSGFILGSGLIAKEYARALPRANILALRGELSRDYTQASSDIVLGDPGLLLPIIFPLEVKKNCLVGLVPHFVDKADLRLHSIRRHHPNEIKIIDVQRHPKAVLEDIAQCEYIFSSSLHGLVVADALGIPNAWLTLSGGIKGHDFKFRDYYSAFNCTFQPVSITGKEEVTRLIDMTHVPPLAVATVQKNLIALFQALPRLL